LIIVTFLFGALARVLADKVPDVLHRVPISEQFVGLVFYTLIPSAAEYMNSVKFALDGHIGLSMEIGNQGAILRALIEFPALVLLSWVIHKLPSMDSVPNASFTLIFPVMEVFCVMIAVLLRNSILLDRAVNYFTGSAFLIIFVLIAVVYYFEGL
jgi:Ca2+:H+ antiporter